MLNKTVTIVLRNPSKSNLLKLKEVHRKVQPRKRNPFSGRFKDLNHLLQPTPSPASALYLLAYKTSKGSKVTQGVVGGGRSDHLEKHRWQKCGNQDCTSMWEHDHMSTANFFHVAVALVIGLDRPTWLQSLTTRVLGARDLPNAKLVACKPPAL